MQSRLSRAEYWLLETVADSPCLLTLLDATRYDEPNDIDAMFNKPGHGLNRDDLIETMTLLVGEKLIEGVRDERPIALDRQAIIAALAEPRRADNPSGTFYQLTHKGGEVWQAFAVPDWSRFVKEELDGDTRTGTLTGMTDWQVEKYLHYLDMLECTLDLPSIQVEEIGPWEATYWKTLPHGHRAHFRWSRRKEHCFENEFSSLAFSGFCEFRDGWYNWR
ncbi:MAG: hypothetical protein K8R46_00455 [Pirellulales bacterium]|nr:hypothetical protein [Pirellulales bacterium]